MMLTVDPELARQADELLEALCASHPVGYTPKLEWRSLRTSAGYADIVRGRIALSVQLLTTPERLSTTLLHEYAHLMAVASVGRKGRGHGPAWKSAMATLGLEPIVRHAFEVKRNSPRQVVEYRCLKCNLTFTRARRLPKRRTYIHRDCGGVLRFAGIRVTTPDNAST